MFSHVEAIFCKISGRLTNLSSKNMIKAVNTGTRAVQFGIENRARGSKPGLLGPNSCFKGMLFPLFIA